MTYSVAAALGVVTALVLDLAVLRTRLVLGRVFWLSYAIILAFQLLANGVLAGRGVVRYDPTAILGPRLAGAPVEDLAFGFALILVTLAVWSLNLPLRAPARGSGLNLPLRAPARSEQPVGGGAGELGEHPGGAVGEISGAQSAQRRLGEVGDALLGPGERTRSDDDLP